MAVPTRPAAGAPIESAWGSIAHDTAVAQDIQAGVAAIAQTAVARFDYPLVFPRPFAAAPAVVAMCLGGSVTLVSGVALSTPTGITLSLFKRDGTNLAAGTSTVYWVAIGPRA